MLIFSLVDGLSAEIHFSDKPDEEKTKADVKAEKDYLKFYDDVYKAIVIMIYYSSCLMLFKRLNFRTTETKEHSMVCHPFSPLGHKLPSLEAAYPNRASS